MNEDARRIVSTESAGKPPEGDAPVKRSAEYGARLAKARSGARFRPFANAEDVVAWVRWVRDAEGPTPDRWRRRK